MKNKLFITGFTAVAVLTAAFTLHVPAELEIGASVPKADVKMKDAVSGNDVSLNDAKGKNGLLVFFSCNTCPYVKLYQERMTDLTIFAKQEKLGVVVINSNEAYRDKDDSFDAMKTYAKDNKFDYPYLVDTNSDLADAFGATRTPQVFLFDKDGKLVYKGAIDDNPKAVAEVKSYFLRDAIRALSKGKTISVPTTKSVGCTIKRTEHKH